MCHMCICHVIPYLFVYSVPSWGPHAGCRQTAHGKLSACTVCSQCGTVSVCLSRWAHCDNVILSMITTLWGKVKGFFLFQFRKHVKN